MLEKRERSIGVRTTEGRANSKASPSTTSCFATALIGREFIASDYVKFTLKPQLRAETLDVG